MDMSMIRKPAVAGQFYPRSPEELRRMVNECIAGSKVVPAPDQVTAIISPHAGYIYSGPTAGFAYARIKGKKPRRVILLGGAHRYPVETASVYGSGVFETPVGAFPIDEDFAHVLIEEFHSTNVTPHLLEHSLEVQLPFLWAAVGEAPIVPVLFGSPSRDWHTRIGRRIASLADDSDLLIASTDLSHYYTEEQANEMDKRSLDCLLKQDPAQLYDGIIADRCAMCGSAAVLAAMAFALERNARTWSVLDYRTSAQVSGDYDRVVGYAAVSMERGG